LEACVKTSISEITSRFQPDINASPDDGSAVSFENGGFQVSYERSSRSSVRSRRSGADVPGVDPAGLPPGDDRGRIYTTTNLRTQASWTLPDSQHFCGGA
jgi:hypothetical protein